MFGTELKFTTFIFLVIMTIIFFNSLYSAIRSNYESSAVRFTELTFLFIIYNLFSGLFPDRNIPFNYTIQLILAYVAGIVMAIYYAYYIYKEFDISPFPYLRVKQLVLFIGGGFILFFVLQYLLTKNLENSRKSFVAIPIVLAGIFLYRVTLKLKNLYKKNQKGIYITLCCFLK